MNPHIKCPTVFATLVVILTFYFQPSVSQWIFHDPYQVPMPFFYYPQQIIIYPINRNLPFENDYRPTNSFPMSPEGIPMIEYGNPLTFFTPGTQGPCKNGSIIMPEEARSSRGICVCECMDEGGNSVEELLKQSGSTVKCTTLDGKCHQTYDKDTRECSGLCQQNAVNSAPQNECDKPNQRFSATYKLCLENARVNAGGVIG